MWIANSRMRFRLAGGLMLVLFFASAAFADDPVPPNQQLHADADTPSYPAPYIRPAVAQPPQSKPVVDAQFISMSALVMGLTIADIETTQHCLGNGTCKELNPLIPHSRAGMYAVNLPINALAMYLSYRLKAGGHKTWWIAPLVISGAHGVGVGFTF